MSLLVLFQPAGAAPSVVFDPLKKHANCNIVDSGLAITNQQINWGACTWAYLVDGPTTGKLYYEFKLTAFSGTGANASIGIGPGTYLVGNIITAGSGGGVTFHSNTGIYLNGTLQTTFSAGWAQNDVIQMCVDYDNDLVWFGRNNSYNGNPAAGTGGVSYDATGKFPGSGVYTKDDTITRKNTGQFTPASQTYSPPAGFTAADSGASGISGVAAITEEDDAVATTATVLIAGTAALTVADDVAVGAAGLLIVGAAALTEADDTAASAGALQVKGVVTVTEDSDTVVSAGNSANNAVANITEADDVAVGASNIQLKATAAITEANDTVATTGVVALKASAAITEANDNVATTGVVTVKGTTALTDAADVAVGAAGLKIQASAAITEGNDTLVSLGQHPIVAQLGVTEADDVVVATSVVIVFTPPPASRQMAVGGPGQDDRDDGSGGRPNVRLDREVQVSGSAANDRGKVSGTPIKQLRSTA